MTDVALTALVAIESLDFDTREVLDGRAARVRARLRGMPPAD